MAQWRSTATYEKLRTARPLEAFMAAEGFFRGPAVVWNDIIESPFHGLSQVDRGAFREVRPEATLLLYQHDLDRPIGKLVSGEETTRGYEIVGQLSKHSTFSDTVQMLKDGLLSMSIGFTPLQTEYRPNPIHGQVRHIMALELFEVSLVSFPASKSAKVEEVQRIRYHTSAPRQAAARHVRVKTVICEILRGGKSTPWNGPQRNSM